LKLKNKIKFPSLLVTEKLSKSLFLIIKNLTEIFDEISPEKKV
jgi:hypothetical protein